MFKDFEPHPLVKGGQMQTVLAHLTGTNLRPLYTKPLYLDLKDGDKILLQLDAPPDLLPKKPVVITFHGLGGCSESDYNLRIARKLNDGGYPVIRFNHRGCGPGARQLAQKIYHAGTTDEILAAIAYTAQLYPERKILPIGFSLSANALLLTLGTRDLSKLTPNLGRVLAVCPPIDLQKCSVAMSKISNKHLDWYYTQRLRKLTDERSEMFENCPPIKWPARMNIRTFDEIFTAPEGGFASLQKYYSSCSSKDVLANITISTDILASKDDPIIPPSSYEGMQLSAKVRFNLTKSGGHMGYLCAGTTKFNDRRWLDEAVFDWVATHSENNYNNN